ncbi:hypothetical protein V8C40DRAFT_167534 [Trichoderma camerunense]
MELFRRLGGVQDTMYGRAGKDGSREDVRSAVLPKGCLFVLLVCFALLYRGLGKRALTRLWLVLLFLFVCGLWYGIYGGYGQWV